MEFKDCGSISYCSIIIHPHHVSVVDNVFSRLCSAQLIYLEHLCSIVYQPLHHAIGAAQSRSSQGKNRTSSTTKILFELLWYWLLMLAAIVQSKSHGWLNPVSVK